jgi:hypothetical protein
MGPFSPSLEFATLHPLPHSVDDTPVASISPPSVITAFMGCAALDSFWPYRPQCVPVATSSSPPRRVRQFCYSASARAAAEILCPRMPSFSLQVLLPGFTSTHHHWRVDIQTCRFGQHGRRPDATVRRKRKVSDYDPLAVGDQTRQAEGNSYLSAVWRYPADVRLLLLQFPISLSCDPPSWLLPLGSFTLRTGFSVTRRLALANLMWHRRQRKPEWSMLG